MRIVYMGTPMIAASVLKSVLAMREEYPQIEIVGVFTQPDKPVGRKQIMTPPEVKVLAEEQGIPVFQPKRIKRPVNVEKVRALQPDLILVTAFGQILSQEILDIPPLGCINCHASLLPEYRGSAPIQWVIVNQEKKTGVTAMMMDAGVDTGDMLMKREVVIDERETAETLYDKLSEEGGKLICEVVKKLLSGETLERTPQDHEKATHAPMISKEDGKIFWERSARSIDALIRGFSSWPEAFTYENGKKCTILKAIPYEEALPEGCAEANAGQAREEFLKGKRPRLIVHTGEGELEILELKVQGKKAMAARDFINGHQMRPIVFGSELEEAN